MFTGRNLNMAFWPGRGAFSLVYFFGHPEAYIIIIPGFEIISHMICSHKISIFKMCLKKVFGQFGYDQWKTYLRHHCYKKASKREGGMFKQNVG